MWISSPDQYLLIDRADARVHVEALSNMLLQKDDEEDHDIPNRLANDLAELPNE
jgi:hypothetical protein